MKALYSTKKEQAVKPDIKKYSFKDAYVLLGASSPEELFEKYLAEDQKIVTSRGVNYLNPKLITNKIREVLEKLNTKKLSRKERHCRLNILWLWYHHAISYAIWDYKDKKLAKEYAKLALEFQPKGHQNKITRLFYLLINNRVLEAEKWVKSISKDPENQVAEELLKFHKNGGFFK